MNVLYISDYRSATGYGKAAIEYIRSLNASDINVYCRPLIFDKSNLEKIPEDIEKIENKRPNNIDVVIQHTLPNHMQYDAEYCNIGMFASETNSFKASGWSDHLNMMDGVFVFNNQMVDACKASGVNQEVKVIPHATNTDKFFRAYKPLDYIKSLKKNDKFIFYTIGEFNRSKNFASLIMAYLLEFGFDENVCLLVKTSCKEEEFFSLCNQISDSIKYKNLPEIALINSRLTEEEINSIHYNSDCFVQTSHGEAWSIPAFDAMCFGKTPIVPAASGYLNYMDNDCGWLVPVYESQVFGMNSNRPDLYRGDEIWWQVDISKTKQFMREAYENKENRTKKGENGMNRAFSFSHAEIGKLLSENIKWAIERKSLSGKTL